MILLKNATLLDMNPPNIRKSMDVLVDGDVIKKIGKNIMAPDAETLDIGGKLLFPGLVCSHHHYYSGLARGIMANIGPTPDFSSILKNLWWRLDRSLDRDSLKSSALICCIDAIRSGTTAVIDHHASPSCLEGSLNIIKEAFESCGLRGTTCYEVTDRNSHEEMLAGVEENRKFALGIDEEKKNGTWSGLFEAHIGGHAPFTLSDESLKLLGDVVNQTGRGFHIHVAEDRYDVSYSHATYGKDMIVRLQDFGLIDDKALMVHGVYLNKDEIKILNDNDTFLVHNARSNMNNNVGYNHSLPLLENLAIGTDGMGGDMFEELKFAYFSHKSNGGHLWPPDFLKALMAGNTILERNFGASFGKLEPGYKADLVIADYVSPTLLEPENIAGHFIFGMGSGIVESVMINGNFVYRDKELLLDIRDIYSEASAQSAEMWKKMDTIKP